MPTSRATRVTSAEKSLSCSTMVLMVLAARRNSPSSGRPSTSSAMLLERSPCATAPITRATSEVGCTKSSMSALMHSTESAQKPREARTEARWRSRPSRPTPWRSRASSRAMWAFCSTTSLNTSETRPATPVQFSGSRTCALPSRSSVSATSSADSSSAGKRLGSSAIFIVPSFTSVTPRPRTRCTGAPVGRG